MKERALVLGGFASVSIAVALLGFASAPAVFLTFVSLALGVVLLLLGLVLLRTEDTQEPRRPSAEGLKRSDRLVGIAGGVLAILAVVASIVAATVAVGDATGHAMGHLVTGSACLMIFIGIAVAWRPTPGSGKASIRGMVLLVLGVSAFGSFIESLGGAGYDAANLEPRVASLASLHGVGVLFGPVALLAIPVGLVVIVSITAAAIAARVRHA